MSPGEIQALARLAGGMDYYCLLRTERTASLDEIRRAYYSARRAFHPDRYLREDAPVQTAVDQISRRINEAWVVLRDSVRRPAYDRGLAEGRLRYTLEDEESRREQSRARTGSTPNGRKFFELASEAEARGEIEKAIAHIQTALTFERDNPVLLEQLTRLRSSRQAGSDDGDSPYAIR